VPFVTVNAEQAEDWNGASGREFIEQRERHERMLDRLTARLLAAAQIQNGETVLDAGCGCGDTTIVAARATRSGHALGADFSRIQIAEARRLASAAGVANVRFEVADVQVHPFGAGVFDVALSNFGVMFFDDPAVAFGNLRKALRRGEPMLIGRDVDDVLEYERASPTATEILTGLSPAQAAELTRQVRDSYLAYASPDGVTMPAAAWLVTAQAV
jgi:ubiquinone/menaquinone biosynthesis C-methylase UbiE